MRNSYRSVLYAFCGGLLLLGCSADESDSAQHAVGVTGSPVEGGQTGALMPICGLSPVARGGDSIPGGDTGIVIHPDGCAALAMAELELRDEDGTTVAFDLEPLVEGAVLLRPRTPLRPGIYHLKIGELEMEAVVAEEPAALPMRLGTVRPLGPDCGAHVELFADPLLLPYLPQLRLAVSADGAPERTWFDYGTLDVRDGRARLSLCSGSEPCLSDGMHTLRLTAELAGELGTLEPIDVTVETLCHGAPTSFAAASTGGAAESAGPAEGASCGVLPGRRLPGTACALLGVLAAVGLLVVRRVRRSSA